MGLFDGFEAGWNSFKNNELKKASDWAISIVPDAQKKEVVDWIKKDPEKAAQAVKKPVDTTFNQLYKLKTGKANISPVLDDATTDFILPDGPTTPVIPIGDSGPIVRETVTEEVVPAIVNGGETVVETVKETVTNVTKGVSDALPIIAIGGAAVLVVALLLGRR